MTIRELLETIYNADIIMDRDVKIQIGTNMYDIDSIFTHITDLNKPEIKALILRGK